MNLQTILDQHAALCEQTWQLILEENRLLKTGGQPPDEEFLERKRQLLARLDTSLTALREQGPHARAGIPKCRTIMEKAQQIILKTLLLDRENEQLLLKCTMTPRPAQAAPKPSATHLQKLYQRHNTQPF
jgi:flagellar biosynthesis/type III secretory pathway chaperone